MNQSNPSAKQEQHVPKLRYYQQGTIGDRCKVVYPHKLRQLRDSVRDLRSELEGLEQEIEEVLDTDGGQITGGQENRISSLYRSLIKNLGAVHTLQSLGIFNRRIK